MKIDIFEVDENQLLGRVVDQQWTKFIALDTDYNTMKLVSGWEIRWHAYLNNYLSKYAGSCDSDIIVFNFDTDADYTFFLLAHK